MWSDRMVKKILIIEDESQTRNLFLKCLTFEGFFALGAASGMAGIALAQSHQPAIIVCDIMMPDINGYDVLRSLRDNAKTASIPFIFLTAKVAMADLRQGMELGADDYLTKPCTVEQFLGAIATRLKRQHDLMNLFRQNAQPNGDNNHNNAKPSNLADTPSNSAGNTASFPTHHIFPDCPKLDKVFRFIESHYQQSINLRDVAQVAGYSPAYLTNLVQNQTGRTVKQWIIERRMEQARSMLMSTAKSVKQVAEAVGYSDVGYFVRQFRQVHGMPPQSWRTTSATQSIDTYRSTA